MRINVKKFLFIGTEDVKEHFFKKAQKAGFIDFIDTRTKPGSKEIPPEIQRISNAIKILRHYPTVEQEENYDLINAESIVDNILRLHQENEKLNEDMRILKLEMARIDVFGDFSLEDIHYIEKEGHSKIQFFAGRPALFQNDPEPENLKFIASEHGLNYYMAVNSQPTHYEKLVEIKIDQSLGKLKERFQEAQSKQRNVEHELKEYAKYNHFLHHFLFEALNKSNLNLSQTYVQETMGGSLFAVEGWIPVNRIDDIQELIENMPIHVDEISIEPDDLVPTYLENEGFHRLGEDLINIYDTPSHTDKDPSIWVLGSFALFFAFIVGDAGYGLVYLLIALFIRFRFPNLKSTGKRVLNLFTTLSVACIIWGVLVTSFFGMQVAPGNPLRKVSLLHWLAEKKAVYHYEHKDATYQDWISKYPDLVNVKDPKTILTYSPHEAATTEHPILNKLSDNVLFELALFIGVVHIILSLLRYIRRNWHGAGWIAFLVGSYLYFANYLGAPTILNYVGGIDLVKGGEVGLHLMVGGIIFAVVGSIIKHGITGIFELMNVIQVFADILSYLRLYALGLAGAIVSGTINEIAGGVPLVLSIVLIACAHFVNIVLATMSGVIHGLRLNFIEWYHYSFEGGGKKFRPLKLLKIE